MSAALLAPLIRPALATLAADPAPGFFARIISAFSSARFTWHSRVPMWPWPIPAWLLVTIFVAAFVLVGYLYRAQQQIAPRRTVRWLTAIRALLLAMLLLLMLQPAMVWTHTSTSAGTLFVVADQSMSMSITDPQATQIERLHWADALGYLPASLRPVRPDVQLARLVCLHEVFTQLRPSGDRLTPLANDAARVAAYVARLRNFEQQVTKLSSELTDDPGIKGQPDGVIGSLKRVAELVREAAGHAAGETSLRAAVDDVSWGPLQTNLDLAINELRKYADDTDRQFLAEHGASLPVQTALAKVDKLTRAQQAILTLTEHGDRSKQSLADLLPQYHTRIISVADSAQSYNVNDPYQLKQTVNEAFKPTGHATNLAAALRMVNEQLGAEENASVVILSDGGQNVKDDPTEPARLLAARGVQVNALLMGSQELSPDAAVEQIDAPEWVYKDDTLKATAVLRLDGVQNKPLKVTFYRGEQLLDTQTVTPHQKQAIERVTFNDKPPEVRPYDYQVRVEDLPGEINTINNRQSFRVAVKKDKLAALIIDGRPRWEYQYLVGVLGRDQRIKLQTVQLDPAEVQGVTQPKYPPASPDNDRREASMPTTPDQWNAFDLFVLGDVPPAAFPAAEQQALAAAVRDRGATLIVIAGQEHLPADYSNTPLAELFPVENAAAWGEQSIAQHMREGFRPSVAPEGAGLVLTQFGVTPERNAAIWANMPLWYWHSPLTWAKPAASVIWSITEPAGGNDAGVGTIAGARRRALLATMSVGLGRVLYLASDQTWRLRQVDGEDVHGRFWGQVISWAVGSDLPAGGRFVRFGVDRPRYGAGDPVTVTARVLREDLTPYTGQSFDAVARTVAEPGKSAPDKPQTVHVRMVERPEAPGYYRGTFSGLPEGTWEISLDGPEVTRLLDIDPSVTQRSLVIHVLPQVNLERRDMNTDPAMLLRITQAGGGTTLAGPYADVLASNLPRLEQVHTTVEQAGFFTSVQDRLTWYVHIGFLTLFVVLISLEWILRKRAGLI